MNPCFRLVHVWMLCLAASLVCGTSVRGVQADKKIDDKKIDSLARAYRAARTELERRAVCLDAIDAGVVAKGRSVAVVDAVFGTTWARKLPPPGGGLEWGVVDFHPLPPPPDDAFSAAHMGWYLALQFDSAGTVQNYHLSNVHK